MNKMFVILTPVDQVLQLHLVKEAVSAHVPQASLEIHIKDAGQSASSILTVIEILPALITSVLTHVLALVVSMPLVQSSTIIQHVSVLKDMLEMHLKSV